MALVEVNGLTKVFGGLTALNGIDMVVETGEIHGLIGPNGAGKTTLFNILTGNYQATAGSFSYAGREISSLRNDQRVALGIVRTFQNIRLFSSMTVLDNVKLGFHARTKTNWLSSIIMAGYTRQEEKQVDEEARGLLKEFGIAELSNEKAGNLSYGNQRRAELARALAAKPRLLLLDEPAAGMNEAEGQELLRAIENIRRDGTTIILVEHDMRLVMSISDGITVLAHGEKIAEGTPREVQNNSRVLEEYLGKGGLA